MLPIKDFHRASSDSWELLASFGNYQYWHEKIYNTTAIVIGESKNPSLATPSSVRVINILQLIQIKNPAAPIATLHASKIDILDLLSEQTGNHDFFIIQITLEEALFLSSYCNMTLIVGNNHYRLITVPHGFRGQK